MLQEAGLAPGECPERWNLTHREEVKAIARAYYDGGSNVVCTNTFGANPLKFPKGELEEIISAAVEIVREAQKESRGTQEKFIALDVGPSGRLLKPLGDLDFEDAVSLFSETIRIGAAQGVDLILIETMNDSYETKAALLAAKEVCRLPVFVSNAYGADGRLLNGTDPEGMVALLEGMGADAVGANCSLGPDQLQPVVERLLAAASVPVLLKPNAGLPRNEAGKTVFDVSPQAFAQSVARQMAQGVRIAGGCCGTTPEYIKALLASAKDLTPKTVEPKDFCRISSYTHAVTFDKAPVLIGERINPTGKKRFQQALRERDMNYVLQEGLAQQEKGVHVLDVNVGIPGIDEADLLTETVCALQSVSDLPLQIDTSDPSAMEQALRRYNGKALINSVNGKEESMKALFPLMKKYGGVAVALTLDESGIPPTAQGRVQIAQRILSTAEAYGIEKKDLLFDPLAMTVSADQRAALVTLESVALLQAMGCRTSLGVSNVSFGLPHRDTVNGVFFAAALDRGLSAAIMNPHATEMMKVYYAHCLLHGLDENCTQYLAFASTLPQPTTASPSQTGAASPAASGTPTGTATASAIATTTPAASGTPATVTASGTPGAASGLPTGAASELRTEVTASGTPGTGCADGRDRGWRLQSAIRKGLKGEAGQLTEELLKVLPPLEIVNGEIVPALDAVGKGYEDKTVFLPQLLMSAEAAQEAFEKIKRHLLAQETPSQTKGPVVLATVRGDIHDIGKNIIKLLMENYGFSVIDLGKDVPPQSVVDAVLRHGAPLVGLSALMTTTLPAMEETVRRLRAQAPQCKIMVGGAVLTPEYAEKIGADAYGKDAMAAVRYAESITKKDLE